MKNYKTYFVAVAVIATIVFSSAHARTIREDLGCTQSVKKPEFFSRPARPNIQYSVTTKGIRVDGVGVDDVDVDAEVVNVIDENGNDIVYTDGMDADGVTVVFKKTMADYDVDDCSNQCLEATAILGKKHVGFRPVIRAQCSSGGKNSNNIWPADMVLTCNKGDRLVVALYKPTCEVTNNQYVVFAVTEIEIKDVSEEMVSVSVKPEIAADLRIGDGENISSRVAATHIAGKCGDGFGGSF